MATLMMASCEEPFQPVQPGNLAFSIYGLLEVTTQAGQRQWVRVTPIRTTLTTAPGPIDAVVTLEDVETGVSVVMTDSLVRYQPVNFADTAAYAHNFSTTMPLLAGREYRLTATRSDGENSSATVRMPTVASPRLANSSPQTTVRGVAHIAMAYGIFELAQGEGRWREYLPIRRYDFEDGLFPAFGYWVGNRPNFIPDPPPLGPLVSALVVITGEPWPWRIDDSAPAPTSPGAPTNVDGGAGFVAGVLGLDCPADGSSCRVVRLFDGSINW